jgi:ribosomal protein L37E
MRLTLDSQIPFPEQREQPSYNWQQQSNPDAEEASPDTKESSLDTKESSPQQEDSKHETQVCRRLGQQSWLRRSISIQAGFGFKRLSGQIGRCLGRHPNQIRCVTIVANQAHSNTQ